MIRLKKESGAFTYNRTFTYLIVYDHSSGRKGRYTVYVTTSDDPVTIGRELPLDSARTCIERFEEFAPKGWIGNRRPVLNTLKRVIAGNLQRAVNHYA